MPGQIYDLIQSEFQSVFEAIADLQLQVNQLREAKNRMIMVGECIRVVGNRCEMGFGKVDGDWRQRSGLVPWLDRAGSDFKTFSPPSIGEQGVLLNFADGDSLNAGVAVFGIRSDRNPLPSQNLDERVVEFENCFRLVASKDGRSIELDVPELIVQGNLVADSVESRTSVSDAWRSMDDIVNTYNHHSHGNNGVAPPSELIS